MYRKETSHCNQASHRNIKTSSAVYVSHDTVALPRNHFAVETAMHPVCGVELHVTVNCIKILSAAQQCL
jgi:hypothetical protein